MGFGLRVTPKLKYKMQKMEMAGQPYSEFFNAFRGSAEAHEAIKPQCQHQSASFLAYGKLKDYYPV
jgi:hypothetical protein